MSRGSIFVSILTLSLFAPLLSAQTGFQAYHVDLSIPFGTVQGTMLTLADALIFVDTEEVGSSFLVDRSDVTELRAEEGVLTVVTAAPVRDRSGARQRFVFRIDPKAGAALALWHTAAPSMSASQTAAGGTVAPTVTAHTYEVEHKHFPTGRCQGKLIISDQGIAFESLSNINHSRQWAFKDIREIRLPNPYLLELKPFQGSDYNFQVQGSGMDVTDFRKLADAIAHSRSQR